MKNSPSHCRKEELNSFIASGIKELLKSLGEAGRREQPGEEHVPLPGDGAVWSPMAEPQPFT